MKYLLDKKRNSFPIIFPLGFWPFLICILKSKDRKADIETRNCHTRFAKFCTHSNVMDLKAQFELAQSGSFSAYGRM